jgi:hypothetical protein
MYLWMLLLLLPLPLPLPMNDDDDDPAQASSCTSIEMVRCQPQPGQPAPAAPVPAAPTPVLATSSTSKDVRALFPRLLSSPQPLFLCFTFGPSFNVSDLMHRPASRDVYGMCGVELTNLTD